MISVTLILLVLCLTTGQGKCPPNIVQNIKSFWSGKPPTNIMNQLVGNITWLTAPPFFEEKVDMLVCVQTIVSRDRKSAKDLVYYKNYSLPTIDIYNMIQSEPGVVTLRGDFVQNDEKIYVISLRNNVLVYFQCQIREKETYNGFGGFAVVNVNSKKIFNTIKITEEVMFVSIAVRDLGLRTLKFMNIECDD